MREIAESYLRERISISLPILGIPVPCNTTCLILSKYKDLLAIENFKAQVEVLDSLINLIEDKIFTLKYELQDKFLQYLNNIDIDNLVYAVYKIIEEGGNVILGDKIYFGDRKVAEGDFITLMNINKLIEHVTKEDSNIKSLCDEIRYLSESTWEHFEKNIRRSLNES
ncbi:MAG: hypothetical protein RRA45_00450 [Saccharolobus sp.]|jgi:hypothetical protein|uniref:hypothetical protein n=1 Tax=Saccharolobus sp. TaxID=2100761 RepID=UPI0028CF1699|nr:hypothetical protein [Saccharolobus sp.]MDT7860681.1 hypothetical protein [Saccharolobus sp.]